MNDEFALRENLVDLCQRLDQRGLLAAADGNVSCRLGMDHFLVTPSGVEKSRLHPEQLIKIDQKAKVVGQGKPSSEWLMHHKVFQKVPAAQVVAHAHPPYAIAWSIAKPELKELPANCMSEVILALGSIPIAPFAHPGTSEMADHIDGLLPASRAMILARHGALSWGESFDEAYRGLDRIENTAKILKYANDIGGLSELSREQVDRLQEARRSIGPTSL